MNFTGFPLECLQRLPISLCEEALQLAPDGKRLQKVRLWGILTVLTVKGKKMSTTPSVLECPFTKGEAPKTPATIEATGKATLEQLPDKGQLRVALNEEASTPEEAWQKFQGKTQELIAALGTSSTTGTIQPTQDSKMVSATLRAEREVFVVSADVTVYFDIDNFGSVIAAMAQNQFAYSHILFTYTDKMEVTPELLEQASKNARLTAEAIARGAGKTIGRLVSIHIGQAERKTYRDNDTFFNLSNSILAMRTTTSNIKLDPSLFDVNMESLQTHNVVAHVTARFEIVE